MTQVVPLIDPDMIPTWSEPPRHHTSECASPPLHRMGPRQKRPRTRRALHPTGAARQQLSRGTEGSDCQESRRRSRRRTRRSPGWGRAPAFRTHQEPARQQRRHRQPQGCADNLRRREAIDRPRVAIATRSGAGYQGQATARRGANDDLDRTLTVLMGRAGPRGLRSLDQDGGRQDDGDNACHTEATTKATTEATHPDRTLAGATPPTSDDRGVRRGGPSCQRALPTGPLAPTGGTPRFLPCLLSGQPIRRNEWEETR
jgi:hypothetical protein